MRVQGFRVFRVLGFRVFGGFLGCKVFRAWGFRVPLRVEGLRAQGL